jgi:hypothetical protein
MSQDEVVAVMKARHDEYNIVSREEWEQTRLQCFYSATAFGGKIKQPKELFKFPWDDEKKKIEGEIKTRTKEEAMAILQEMHKSRQGGK